MTADEMRPRRRAPVGRRTLRPLSRCCSRRPAASSPCSPASPVGTVGVSLPARARRSASPASRVVSLGFYVVGCFLLVAGFFVGNRGPVRVASEEAHGRASASAATALRGATREEQEEALDTSALFVVLGFVLIVLGVVVDNRVRARLACELRLDRSL